MTDANKAFWKGGLPLDETEAASKGIPQAPSEKATKGYFEGEWGSRAATIESFGIAFIKCLKKEGWSAILNPIVAFLKILFKIDPSVEITDAGFSSIQEAYNTNKLTEKDLRGEGSLGKLNLIFNAKLYKKKGAEITEYLSWQYEAIHANNIPAGVSIKTIFANIASKDGKSDLSELKNDEMLKALETSNFQYEIRQLTNFKELIKTSLKVSGPNKAKEVEQATDEEVELIVSKITSPGAAKKFLAYLVNLYRIKNYQLLQKLIKEPFGEKLKRNHDSTSTTFDEDVFFDNLLNISGKKYAAEQLKTLITKLIDIAKL